MKAVVIVIAGIITGYMAGELFLRKYSNDTDLEIYTDKNIYYIDGLTVTNEANTKVLTFNNNKSLKEYVSNVTSEDLNN